jgi:hypothetical protein
MNNNNSQGVINSFATQSVLFASGAVSGPTINSNVHAGSTTVLSHISSSIVYQNNISDSSNLLIRNSATHPLATNGSGSVTVGNNIFGGGATLLTISGSGVQGTKGINNNIVVGINNELNIIVSGSNSFISNTGIIGTSLIVSGSNSGVGAGGSTFVGRFNATGSLQESSQETVFVVGTGTGAAGRRNALRIDNNNNSNFTGSVNISGSLLLNGVAVGSSDRNGLITTGSNVTYPTQTINGSLQISSGSLWARGRNSLNNLAYGELALENITTANSNTGLGNSALQSATTGGGNLAVGGAALSNMTTGQNNVGIGNQALLNNISGSNNMAIGANSLQNNVAGFNTAIGTDSLRNNTTGQYNNAIGDASLYFNTTGESNVAIGKNTLFANTIGGSNIGIGGGAMSSNVSGSNNVAIGGDALRNSVAGFNLAVGGAALSANTTGQYNVGIGQSAFQGNTIGEKNTAIGWNSGVNNSTGSTNTIIGAQSLQNNVNGSGNVAIGHYAGYYSTGSNGFYVGNDNYGGLTDEQNKSLFYGEFNSTTANQTLQINAQTSVRGNLAVSGSLNISGSARTLTVNNKLYVTASNNSAAVEVRGPLGYTSILPAYLEFVNNTTGDFITIYENKIDFTSGSISSTSSGFNMSNSLTVTGSLSVSSLSDATGSFIVTTDSTGTLTKSPYSAVTSNLFSVGDFYSTQTQTLAAGVSGSVTYNNTGTSFGVSLVSSSRLTVANAGVYSITFSAQLLGDGGQDAVYMWLKKNGTNVADTGTKMVVKNNEEHVMTVEYIVQAAASDYYEIVWQNTTGDGDLKYYAASGNIPAIPSIITTVKQVR